MYSERKHLSTAALLDQAYEVFVEIPEPINEQALKIRPVNIPLVDCLMSALAMFSFKYPSMLQFEEDKSSEQALRTNLRNLFNTDFHKFISATILVVRFLKFNCV